VTAQQADGWSRRVFLRNLTLAGAAGVFGVYPRRVAAVDEPQTCVSPDNPAALGVCPQRDANAHEICPNCCNYRYEAM
jgi:hypothetical protein